MAETKTAGTPKLSKSAVVDRALQLADTQGLDTLTIRKLAAELGVTPMALYWHYRSKEELLGGLVDRVWGEIDVEFDRTAPWPNQLRTLLESLLRVLRAHPSASRLLLEFEKQSPAAMRPTEVTLDVLRGAGFSPQRAADIARLALWTGIMLVMSEPGAAWLSSEEREDQQRTKQITYATLPRTSYPRLVECAIPLTACDDPDSHYEFGVTLFIAGVEAIAARNEPDEIER